MSSERIVTPPNSVRVFWGYRSTHLAGGEAEFRRMLGETFMPGTPYMLRPLGLHAYAAAVFDEDVVRDTPHETGLIAYPSQAAYRTIRTRNLRGRLYTTTHAAVYDEFNPDGTRRSSAQFAEQFTDDLDDAARTVYLVDEPSDLQRGKLVVHLGVPTDVANAGRRFRHDVREALPMLRDAVRDHGFSQAFITVRDNYYVAWVHSEEELNADPIDDWLATSTRLGMHTSERVLFLEDSPIVAIDRPSAFNFIFLRSVEAGLG